MAYDEQQVIARLRSGDGAALAEVTRRYGARVTQLAFRYVKNWEDAEEVAQDVWLKVFRRIDAFREDAALSSWIFRITFNAAMSRLRGRRYRESQPLLLPDGQLVQDPVDESLGAEDRLLRAEVQTSVRLAVLGLPEPFQLPILLRDFEELSTEAAAQELHLHPATLKSRLHRGRLELARRYVRRPARKETTMQEQTISLADGGMITVCLSRTARMPSEFEHHPMVHVLESGSLVSADAEKAFPSNSKAIITTQGLPSSFYHAVQAEARRRRHLILYRPTIGGLRDLIGSILATAKKPSNNGSGTALGDAARITMVTPPATDAPKDDAKAERGWLKAFVIKHDNPQESIAVAGRRIFRLAQQQSLQTTLGSVTQCVSTSRRKAGHAAPPESVAPKDVPQQVGGVILIEQAIESLQGTIKSLEALKTWVANIDGELDSARKQMETVRALAALAKELN